MIVLGEFPAWELLLTPQQLREKRGEYKGVCVPKSCPKILLSSNENLHEVKGIHQALES